MRPLKGALCACAIIIFSASLSYALKPPVDAEKQFEHRIKEGLTYNKVKAYDGAEEYKRALSFDAEDTNTLFNLGTMYLKTNRPREAVKVFKAVVTKNSKDTEAYNLLGLAYRGCGMKTEAIEIWEKSLSIDPTQTMPKRFIEEAKE